MHDPSKPPTGDPSKCPFISAFDAALAAFKSRDDAAARQAPTAGTDPASAPPPAERSSESATPAKPDPSLG